MVRKDELSSRERVRLALEHQETDRIPIAMVCAGLNPPVYRALEVYLQQERGMNVESYLNAFLDVREVAPQYIGPLLEPGKDMWGVQRQAVSYGSGSYDEIIDYPLKDVESLDDLQNYPWPTTDLFDYAILDERIRAVQQEREHCLMISNGNIFETSWYMRGFEQMLLDLVMNPELAHEIMERVTVFFSRPFHQNVGSRGWSHRSGVYRRRYRRAERPAHVPGDVGEASETLSCPAQYSHSRIRSQSHLSYRWFGDESCGWVDRYGH